MSLFKSDDQDLHWVVIKNLAAAFWTTVAANERGIYMVSQYPDILSSTQQMWVW